MFHLFLANALLVGSLCFASSEKAEILSVRSVGIANEAGSLKTPREEVPFQNVSVAIEGKSEAVGQPIVIPDDDFKSNDLPEEQVVRKELDPKFCTGEVSGVPQYTVQNKLGGFQVKGIKAHRLPISGNLVRIRYATGNIGELFVRCK